LLYAYWKGEQAVQQPVTDFSDLETAVPGPEDDDGPDGDEDEREPSTSQEAEEDSS
jgi:hypothetical protein